MQSVALEMNQAETAFLIPSSSSDPSSSTSSFLLRWFTPAAEVDLCGHATLASSHYLFATGRVPLSNAIHFATRSGTLIARTLPSPTPSPSPLIEISLPCDPPSPVEPSSAEYRTIEPILLRSLHLPASPALTVLKGKFDYLVLLPSFEAVTSMTPDFSAMKAISTRGVGVTARGGRDETIDFTSRFFAPALGIDEDPVTGSAHCMLHAYWAPQLGKEEMVGHQASARGGLVRVQGDGDRVRLQGHAVHTLRGHLLV